MGRSNLYDTRRNLHTIGLQESNGHRRECKRWHTDQNPSEDETLLQLADEQGLIFDQFEKAFYSEAVAEQLRKEVALTQALQVPGFPFWVLKKGENYHRINVDYQSAHPTLAQMSEIMQN